jgi:hypothetical protein
LLNNEIIIDSDINATKQYNALKKKKTTPWRYFYCIIT